jgi:hypothetical protein
VRKLESAKIVDNEIYLHYTILDRGNQETFWVLKRLGEKNEKNFHKEEMRA